MLDEFMEADIVVLGVPHARLDNSYAAQVLTSLIVPGKTFTYGQQGVEEGLVRLLCFISPLPGNTTLVSCDAIENADPTIPKINFL
jgi:hypothetical protein